MKKRVTLLTLLLQVLAAGLCLTLNKPLMNWYSFTTCITIMHEIPQDLANSRNYEEVLRILKSKHDPTYALVNREEAETIRVFEGFRSGPR